MNGDLITTTACLAIGVPLLLGLCLLTAVACLKLAAPTVLMLLNALSDLRDRDQQFALARMANQIELAKVHQRGRSDHARAA